MSEERLNRRGLLTINYNTIDPRQVIEDSVYSIFLCIQSPLICLKITIQVFCEVLRKLLYFINYS